MTEQIQKHNFALGLCVKDNAVGLPKCFKNISKLRTLFDKFMIVIYYDNSKDNSLELCLELTKKYDLKTNIINENCKNQTLLNARTINIANARNHIVKYINSDEHSDYKLFGMMDTNNYSCQGDIKLDVIEKYLNDKTMFDKWDSLSFARKPYYDKWAYSSDIFQIGCWSYPRLNDGYSCTAYKYMEDMGDHINKTLLAEENKGKLLPVDSAFCGFAFYKKDKFKNCIYNGYYNLNYIDKTMMKYNLQKYPLKNIITNMGDCEHRQFHMMGKRLNNANIMVACDQAFTHFE